MTASVNPFDPARLRLDGKKGLIVGIANAQSIAYGCAQATRALGADLAMTYLNDKAKPHVAPLAEGLGAALLLPLNVAEAGALEAVFEAIRTRWGKLDFLIHSIAFAPKADLQGRLTDSSGPGFAEAMDVSCHSFIRMARLAEPLMTDGGTLFAMSYLGAQKVVEHYNLMGPVKAALESAGRYLAAELAPKNIRVHIVSPGPIPTRAASGLAEFETLIEETQERTPGHRLATIEDVGLAVALLATDAARIVTGDTIFIDGGYHLMG